jgi:hypothetical protein
MKPFDLEKALAGAPVVTRDGREILYIHHHPEALNDYQVVAFIKDQSAADYFCADGKFSSEITRETNNDLFMASKVKTYYVSIIENTKDNRIFCCNHLYASPEEISRDTLHYPFIRVKVVPIELEVD